MKFRALSPLIWFTWLAITVGQCRAFVVGPSLTNSQLCKTIKPLIRTSEAYQTSFPRGTSRRGVNVAQGRAISSSISEDVSNSKSKYSAATDTHVAHKASKPIPKLRPREKQLLSPKQAKMVATASLAALLLTATLPSPATSTMSGGSFTEPSHTRTPTTRSQDYRNSPEYLRGFRRGFRSGYYTSPPRIAFSPYGYGTYPFVSPFGTSPFGYPPFFSPYYERYYVNPFGYPHYHVFPKPFFGFEFRF